MSRLQKTPSLPRLPVAPKTVQPGHYLFWGHRVYRVTALDPDNALLLHVETLPATEPATLSLTALLAQSHPDTPAALFAVSLPALHEQIEELYALPTSALTHDVPVNFVIKAQMVIKVVELVTTVVEDDERRARGHGEAFSHSSALRRALSICNGATIEVQVKGTCQHRTLRFGLTTYYKYARLYATYHGDAAQIAASFHRSTFRLARMSTAQFHFLDMCLLLYYGGTRYTKARVYRLAQEILDARTHGLWVDPDRCGKDIPQNLVTELLDLKLPMQAILDNPEKKTLLTPIEMPSPAWFYRYATYLEAQADQGKAMMTQRLGQDIWEQYHLVFETFVRRAQLPLQYVFADHWKIDAWIVDEATRSQPTRLWLTLLVDAYSRSILGMALLYEDPCIESIQHALRHAIWQKESHTRLGIEQEWSCDGIPQQLFLDNAWAHHSHSLENLARVISRSGTYNSIDLVFRPPYKGRYGAIIERLFKNFSGQLKELVDGAMGALDPHERRSAAHNACLLYPDMNRILHQLILKYQHTPHRELHGMTPQQKWSEGVQASGFPLVPPFTPAMDRLFMRMSPQTRQVSSTGIPAFGMHYWSAELGGIERVGRDGKAVQYYFRYDPADMSRIALFRDGEWVGDGYARELEQADGTFRQVSLAEWKMARRLVFDEAPHTEGKTPQELVLATDLKELGRQRLDEKKAVQRQQQRKGTRSSPSTPEPTMNTAREPAPSPNIDEETERVLRFLHQ